jgi:hypothetical protein
MAIKKQNKRFKPYFVTSDSFGKPKAPHKNIWVNMLHGYCGVLDPSINNINAQPHVLMNTVKSRLEDQWEYVGYDLSYREFKAQVNVYLKNKQHSLKLFIEVGEPRLRDCSEDHWENMKHLIALEVKQGEATKYRAMQALVATPNHFGHGGKVGVTPI